MLVHELANDTHGIVWVVGAAKSVFALAQIIIGARRERVSAVVGSSLQKDNGGDLSQ
jgi:hypothetical protein